MGARHKPRLDYAVFELTSSCNLRCRYCYNIWKRPGAPAPAGESSYGGALRTLKRLFSAANVKHVTFTGGEPLLVERLPELVLFCRLRKKGVTIITNGNAGSPELYRRLIGLGVSLFELPLHSPDSEPHDLMTGVPGSWEKSLGSIRLLLSLHAAVVPVIVITKVNCSRVRETIGFLRGLGCSRIMLNRFNIGGAGIDQSDSMRPSLGELRRAFADAQAVCREHYVSLSSNVCAPACVIDPSAYPAIAFSVCNPGDITRRPLTLTAGGDLRFCNHSPVTMGSIFTQGIDAILRSDYVREWATTVPEHCRGCVRYPRCFGGCRAASEQLGLTLRDVDPSVKTYGVPSFAAV